MKRVIVLGGLGLFGRTIVEQLRQFRIAAQTASRSAAANLRIDANDSESIRSELRTGDIVLDAAGPFHSRSIALVQSAIEIGFDVIDINDNLRYAESVVALQPQIAATGIRVLSSASSVSAVAAAVMKHSGIDRPTRVSAFLAPASRHTANAGTALSLIQSLGRSIRILRARQLQLATGWSESRQFPMSQPVGPVRGHLFESADALYLPRIWPTLTDVAMYVDSNIPGMNSMLRLAANSNIIRALLQRGVHFGTAVARKIGTSAGGIGYEIEDATGHIVRYAVTAKRNSYLTAIAPAVLAARAIVEDRFPSRGFVMPDHHVEPREVIAFLSAAGIELRKL